jgi:hypothetical protein
MTAAVPLREERSRSLALSSESLMRVARADDGGASVRILRLSSGQSADREAGSGQQAKIRTLSDSHTYRLGFADHDALSPVGHLVVVPLLVAVRVATVVRKHQARLTGGPATGRRA